MIVPTEVVWFNGSLRELADAKIDTLAHGLLYGAGVYDSLLLRRGVAVALDRHLARLTLGASRLGLTVPEVEIVRSAIGDLSSARGLSDGRVRITLAAGPSQSVRPGVPEGNIVIITLIPLLPAKSSAAITMAPFRRNEHGALTGTKHTACAENILAQRAALAAGFDEAVFLNTAGQLCEGAFSNVFLVREGRVLTPPLSSGCLPGVTREVVLELCRLHAIPCGEEELYAGDLGLADEIFLTSSIRGLQPVSRLEAQIYTVPGPVTGCLMALYDTWLVSQD
jgi:branched-chain amino acid aminotransferase